MATWGIFGAANQTGSRFIGEFNITSRQLVINDSHDIEINADGGDIYFKDGDTILATINSSGLSLIDNTGGTVIFEGSTDDTNQTHLSATDPSAVRAILLPDASGTVALTSDLTSYLTASGSEFEMLTMPSSGTTLVSNSGLTYASIANLMRIGSESDDAAYIQRRSSSGDGGKLILMGGDAATGTTNNPGGNIELHPGDGTGSADGGNIVFELSTGGTSGTSTNTGVSSKATWDSDDFYTYTGTKVMYGANDNTNFDIKRLAHSDGPGGDLSLKAGDATDGQTDKSGGNLNFYTGLTTGTGTSGAMNFYFSDVGTGSGSSIEAHQLGALFQTSATETIFKLMELGGATSDDYCQITVAAQGSTVISTIDANAHAADLRLKPDGDLYFDNDTFGLTKFTSDGVEIENAAASGAPALLIDNKDVDQSALKIEPLNTTAHIIDIDASNLETASGIYINDDSYERAVGHIRLDITDTHTATLNRGGYGLFALHYERPSGSPVASGQTLAATGIEVRMDDNATNVGTFSKTGLDIYIDNVSALGTIKNYGITTRVGGGDTNYDIYMINNADDSEFATMAVGAGGRFDITTNSDDATGHVTIDSDGDITLDAGTGNIYLQDAGGNYTPGSDYEAATKKYVDDSIPDEVVSSGINTLKTTKVVLSEANLNSLHTSAITLVAAAGANQIIVPISYLILVDRDASTAQSASGVDLFISWDGSTSAGKYLGYMRRFMYNESGDRTYTITGSSASTENWDDDDPSDKPVQIKFDSAITSGSLDSMTVYTTYYVIDNS